MGYAGGMPQPTPQPGSRFWRDASLPFIEARTVGDGRKLCYGRHAHETFSIGAIRAGRTDYLNQSARRQVGPGTVVLMNPGDVHACNPIADETWSYRMLYVDRAWLAGLQLMFAQISKLNFAADSGVDSVLTAEAAKDGKQLRYLETIADQFALLAPDDRKLELQEFESGLKDLRDVAGEIEPMVKAWGAGDQVRLDRLINGDLDEFPEARKLLLDDRNHGWLPQIEAMLKEKHVFFITVGAGHLTGPMGVPALLRKDGYKVEGP